MGLPYKLLFLLKIVGTVHCLGSVFVVVNLERIVVFHHSVVEFIGAVVGLTCCIQECLTCYFEAVHKDISNACALSGEAVDEVVHC